MEVTCIRFISIKQRQINNLIFVKIKCMYNIDYTLLEDVYTKKQD